MQYSVGSQLVGHESDVVTVKPPGSDDVNGMVTGGSHLHQVGWELSTKYVNHHDTQPSLRHIFETTSTPKRSHPHMVKKTRVFLPDRPDW